MKRCFSLLLLTVFLLCGCASEEPQETTESTTESTTVETTAPGTYETDSEMEQQTDGAVKAYSLEGDNYLWIKLMNGSLLLASGEDTLELTCLTDDRRYVSANAELDLPGDEKYWKVTPTAPLVFYSKDTRELYYFDWKLCQYNIISLPEGAFGDPIIAENSYLIYYSTGSEIREYDSVTGISRLIRRFSNGKVELSDLHFDGGIISCFQYDENDKKSILYISSETGQTVSFDQKILSLDTYGSSYFAIRQDGTVLQHIYGDADPGLMTAYDLHVTGQLEPVLALNGVISTELMEDGLHLNFYSLADGKRTSAVTLPGVKKITDITADWTGVWLLAGTESQEKLYHWDVSKSPVEDEEIYSTELQTLDNPDKKGLSECQSRVDALNKKHGLDIRIYKDAVKEQGEYTLELEYQTKAINKCLDELEKVLDLFPENFLYKSVNKRIRICIVRSVSNEQKAVQYWIKDDAFIVLSAGVDVYEGFLKSLGYVVSTNVMGNSPILDSWSSLNPESFEYGNTKDFEDFLSGKKMAFADKESMNSITEDRSRLFWYAMKPDNKAMFQSKTMQAKLILLCKGIRDAWRLERKTDVYPWEQYLHESIAYKKK